MATDGKYGEITTTGKALHPGEPVFLLRATDPFTVDVVREYARFCEAYGCDPAHTAGARAAADRIAAWQRENPALVKDLPD